MNRATTDGQSCFVHGLGQSRMCKAGQGQIFGAGTEFHGDYALGNDFRGLGTNYMETDNAVSFLRRQ